MQAEFLEVKSALANRNKSIAKAKEDGYGDY
jgi:hypothetical protein